jgi:hypothetical protein
MIEFAYGVIAGGALLGFLWMVLTTPAVIAYRSGNGHQATLRRNARDAWALAYLAGVITYILLRSAGVIAY